MITLDEYKNYLIGVYNWPLDGDSLEVLKRKVLINERYSDNYLLKIISDTYSFMKDVLFSETINYGYCKFDIDEDTTLYIDLDLHGGLKSDTLFIDSKQRIISSYLMKKTFGDCFYIGIKCDEIEDNSDDYILSYYYRYYIYMQGFSSNIDEIKEMLANSKVLVR